MNAVSSQQMVWTQVTDNAQFSDRLGHSTVVFDDKLWVIGGWNGDWSCTNNSCYNDVWYSSDGVKWKKATDHAAFGARYAHRSVVFDNRMWVIGGRNTTSRDTSSDVWFSSDGVNWIRATDNAPFVPRADFGLTVFNNEMWVMGGFRDGPLPNDVWHSADGVHWIKATEHAGFSPRMDLTATTFDGKMWVTGGFDRSTYFNDIWFSENGADWTKVTDHAAYPARSFHKTSEADGKMWLIGGIGGENPYTNWHYLTDIWYSSNGIDWTEATADAGFPGRNEFTTAFFKNRLWVIAGSTGNDIWQSQAFEVPTVTGIKPVRDEDIGTEENKSGEILVTKSISPKILKQSTDARITVTVLNQGPAPVHDIEILDTTQPEFPVLDGITQFATQSIEPNGTRILSYTIHAIKPGSFRLNRTAVMYADQDGNYHITYSNYEKVEVLPSLIPPTPQNGADALIRDLLSWINELGDRNAQHPGKPD